MRSWDWQTIFGLDTDRHRIGRSFAVRGLGLIYFIAIISWWSQIGLLVGENGLLPAAKLQEWFAEQALAAGESAFFQLPSLFWWIGASDFAMQFACFLGCLLAALVIIGRFTAPSLVGLWFLYLSFVNTGGVFMSFQWDILLLEAGFLGIFLGSWSMKMSWRNPPPLTVVNRVALVTAWFLLAKLLFFSGWVKLAWVSEASPEWRLGGDAMTFHYMTQPIPTWTAWWVHHWPAWFHRAALFPMYGIELLLPFAICFGRWGRLAAAVGCSVLMVLILLTGNYTYFNWLTIVLCLPLVQDKLWPGFLRKWLKFEPLGLEVPSSLRPIAMNFVFAGPILFVILLLNLGTVLNDFHRAPNSLFSRNLVPGWLARLQAEMAPFHLVSGYGLFRTMTTERPEILLEGSEDGTNWVAYDFVWKVDEISDAPKFVAPHQPRVAWQFWFAALEGRFDYQSRNATWIEALVLKLLNGDPKVRQLLKNDPFPVDPPKWRRARLFRYEFTTFAERKETGNWWKREVIGEYLPPVALPPVTDRKITTP